MTVFRRVLAAAVIGVVWVIVRGIEWLDSEQYETDEVEREALAWDLPVEVEDE